MKKTIFLAYLALLICVLLPLARGRLLPSPPGETPPASAATAPPAPSPSPAPTPDPAPTPFPGAAVPRTLLVKQGDTVLEMDMQDYLEGVVAAEMPAAFPSEALKAQAVAARTYALYCAATGKHADADVCTDYTCCQAWKSREALQESWGADGDANREKIRAAVEETRGQYLSYEGRPVFAAFHASSAGATEDSGRLWSPQPYLISVPSPENADTVPNYVTTLDCSPLDFRDTLLSAWPQADFTGEEETWLGQVRRDESGRVDAVTLGGLEIPGTELRRLFSLRSTAFTLEYREGRFVFTVTGSGHGVGMSQYGARVMADGGAAYPDILAHYYPGTSLVSGG